MSEVPQPAVPGPPPVPVDAASALASLEAAQELPLPERADAFDAFHAALAAVLGTEPGQ